jgi:hypothetical protein
MEEPENPPESLEKISDVKLVQERHSNPPNQNRESETIDSIEPIELVDDCLEELANKGKTIDIQEITNGFSESISSEHKVSETTVEISFEKSITLELEGDRSSLEETDSNRKPKRQVSRIPRIPMAVKK